MATPQLGRERRAHGATAVTSRGDPHAARCHYCSPPSPMTMSEGTAATTLSVGSSGGPVGHARSSIGSSAMPPSGRRDSLGVAGQRPHRSSVGSNPRHDSNASNSAKLTALGRMEQRGGSTTGSISGSDSNQNLADMRHSHYKEGIRLAEMGDWDVLMRRLPREPQLARHKDHHGMLPLHWACTEDDAGPDVVQALLEAFPEGVLTRNNAQYLPIHIAVRAGLPIETLQLLCEARPSSLLEETPVGKTPLMLAIEAGLPAPTVNLLRRAQQSYEDPSEDNDDDRNIENTKRAIEVQSHLLRESMMLNPINMVRQNQPTLSVGRLQSNSVLGSFPAEARSSIAWRNPSGNQSFAGTTNTNSSRSLQHIASTSSVSSSVSSQPGSNAVVRYMDTLMKSSTDMIDEETELMGRYTTDEEHLPARSFLLNNTSQSMTGPPPPSALQRPTQLRATEGDLSNYNSGVCGVCYKKFSMFRKKYQCKSCWMVVCKKHVAAKVELPGHKKKRSVCADCNLLHSEGNNVLPSVPSHPISGGPTFSHTHPGSYNLNSSSAIVPTRGNRAESTTSLVKANSNSGSTRSHALSNASDLRHTVAAPPSRQSQSVRFATENSTAIVQKPSPALQQRAALDRFGSDTTASLTETDRNSAEVTALHHRIGTLEEQNKILLSRLADQEKQYDDCMLLLTQTMTRVAEIEMRMPGLRITTTGSERESESDLNPASFDFGYPLSGAYNSYAMK